MPLEMIFQLGFIRTPSTVENIFETTGVFQMRKDVFSYQFFRLRLISAIVTEKIVLAVHSCLVFDQPAFFFRAKFALVALRYFAQTSMRDRMRFQSASTGGFKRASFTFVLPVLYVL